METHEYKKANFINYIDVEYYVVDSFEENGADFLVVVIDEKIGLYERYKNTVRRDLYMEVIPAAEMEIK